jgi:DNA polymerase-3 subunit epsilon
MKIVKVFYDLETTGTNFKKHSIHQLAGLVEVNGEVVEEFDIRMAPHPKAEVLPEALKASNVTEEQIRAYPAMVRGYNVFTVMMSKYVNKYDNTSKAFLVGFNNRYFDDPFLRMFFELNNDQFIGSLFWSDSRDVLVMASEYLEDRRHLMPSFKLKRVAKELGIPVDETRLHDGVYDVHLTRQIYRIVTGREMEL